MYKAYLNKRLWNNSTSLFCRLKEVTVRMWRIDSNMTCSGRVAIHNVWVYHSIRDWTLHLTAGLLGLFRVMMSSSESEGPLLAVTVWLKWSRQPMGPNRWMSKQWYRRIVQLLKSLDQGGSLLSAIHHKISQLLKSLDQGGSLLSAIHHKISLHIWHCIGKTLEFIF